MQADAREPLQHLQKQAEIEIRKQAKQAPPYVTIILENRSKKGIEISIKYAGGRVKYRVNNKCQIRLSADKTKPFLDKLTQNVAA